MRSTYTPVIILMLLIVLYSCYRPWHTADRPNTYNEPVTTIGLVVTDYAGDCDTFVYKLKNDGAAGRQQLYGETIMLSPYSTYHVGIILLDEQPDTVRDMTKEVAAGADSHLFLFRNTPLAQPGHIEVDRGSRDGKGRPFNHRVRFSTGGPGNSVMNVRLVHRPDSKQAEWADAGDNLDAYAKFPVVITEFNAKMY